MSEFLCACVSVATKLTVKFPAKYFKNTTRDGLGAGYGGERAGRREGRECEGAHRGTWQRSPRCPWATREGRAKHDAGRGAGRGAGRNAGRDARRGAWRSGGVLGAVEDGGVKVLIFSVVIFQREANAQNTRTAPALALRKHVNDGHVKCVTQDVANDVAKDVLGAAKYRSAKVLILPIAIFGTTRGYPPWAFGVLSYSALFFT